MKGNIYLRAFEYADLELLNEIRNDDDAFEFTGGNKYYISSEYNRKWIEDKIFNNEKQVYLAICLKDDKIIGYLGICDIDYRNRKAQWAGINIHKQYAGKGYGTEASELLLKFVFEELGINRFYGYWLETNKASITMAEKVGFTPEGLERDFVYKHNRFHNVLLMSILYKEYCNKNGLQDE